MSIGIRGFVEFLIEKIKEEGILSEPYYSQESVENDLIDKIWNAYDK